MPRKGQPFSVRLGEKEEAYLATICRSLNTSASSFIRTLINEDAARRGAKMVTPAERHAPELLELALNIASGNPGVEAAAARLLKRMGVVDKEES